MKEKIAVLLDNTLTIDRRSKLEIESLCSLDIEVHLFCMKEDGFPQEEIRNNLFIHRCFSSDIFLFRNKKILQIFIQKIGAFNFKILHCHDRIMLRLGTMICEKFPNTKLIYESHELFHEWPLHVSRTGFFIWFKSWIVRKLEIIQEKKDGKKIDYLITVNQSLANILSNYFQIKTPPIITRNIPRLEINIVKSYYIRENFSIPVSNKILVYIGAHLYRHTKRMEQAIEEIAPMKNISIVIITGKDSHSDWFRNWINENKWGNVFFHPLIPIDQITSVLSGCDVGIVSAWNKKDLSYWLALDNKIFSYIMAEIPILASAQPEYKKIVEGFGVGICVDPDIPGSYANGLKLILSQQENYLDFLQKAKKVLCWENEQIKLLELYQQIL